jgi:hypothetical protein
MSTFTNDLARAAAALRIPRDQIGKLASSRRRRRRHRLQRDQSRRNRMTNVSRQLDIAIDLIVTLIEATSNTDRRSESEAAQAVAEALPRLTAKLEQLDQQDPDAVAVITRVVDRLIERTPAKPPH